MNRDIRTIFLPLMAAAAFVFVIAQTLDALRSAGVWTLWTKSPHFAAASADPLARLDLLLADRGAPPSAGMRDPFGIEVVRVTEPVTRPVVRRHVAPAPPARPVLTAIVYDSDPRAIVRWKDRDWTVRPGGLFDEFQVVAITRDQVVLRHGDETVSLTRKPQGE